MMIRPTISHFWCVKARAHVKEIKKKEEKGKREEKRKRRRRRKKERKEEEKKFKKKPRNGNYSMILYGTLYGTLVWNFGLEIVWITCMEKP